MKEEKSTINSNNNRQLNKISTKTKSEKTFCNWVVVVIIIAISSQYKQLAQVGENKKSGSNESFKT